MSFNSGLLNSKLNLISGGEKLIHETVTDPIFQDGEAVQKKNPGIEFLGNVQPVTGEERLQLDENDRTRNEVDIYTRTNISATGFICRCETGERFEVKFVERWGPFFLIRAVEIDVAQNI